MIFEAAKCPSCGSPIQVPAEVETAKCMFCGNSLVVKDAIQKYKIELSGSVKMESNIEPLMKSAQGFLQIQKWSDAERLYFKITELDSTDYRAWWGLFLAKSRNMTLYNSPDSFVDYSDASVALSIAPEKAKSEMYNVFEAYMKNMPNYHNLFISRENKIVGCAVTVFISINNGKAISLDNGQHFKASVSEGICEVKISYSGFTKQNVFIFDLRNDVSLSLAPKMWGHVDLRAEGTKIVSSR